MERIAESEKNITPSVAAIRARKAFGGSSSVIAVIPAENYQEAAVGAACQLCSVWREQHKKLLQQPPSAVAGAKLSQLLANSTDCVTALKTAIDFCPEAAKLELYNSLRAENTLRLLADLVAWLHKAPYLVADLAASAHAPQVDKETCTEPGYVMLWTLSAAALCMLIWLKYGSCANQGEGTHSDNEAAAELAQSGLLQSLPKLLQRLLDKLAASKANSANKYAMACLQLMTAAQRAWPSRNSLGPIVTVDAAVQRCAAMLSADAGGAACSSSSSSSIGERSMSDLAAESVVAAQTEMVRQALYAVGKPAMRSASFCTSKPLVEAALQLIAAATYSLHDQHLTWQQQLIQAEPQLQRSRSSTSARHAIQPQLLDIPPVHERLKLLAAAQQLYVTAVRLVLGAPDPSTRNDWVGVTADVIHAHVLCLQEREDSLAQPARSQVLSAPALLLMLEFALLLAGPTLQQATDNANSLQGLRRACNKAELLTYGTACRVLFWQLVRLKQCNDAGSQVVQQVLLRQSGQQLLQLLQIQLQDTARALARAHAGMLRMDDLGEKRAEVVRYWLQWMVLAVADRQLTKSAQMTMPLDQVEISYDEYLKEDDTKQPLLPHLPGLAAAHPVDCFVYLEGTLRSGLRAQDALLHAKLLTVALQQPPAQMEQLLAQPAAVAAMVSAVAGTVKAWAQFAGDSEPRHGSQAATEKTFADELPLLATRVLGSVAKSAQQQAAAMLEASGGSSSSSDTRSPPTSSMVSSSDSPPGNSCAGSHKQHDASRVLLMVVVARSIIVLCNALDDAGAAHGIPVSQLLASGSVEQLSRAVHQVWMDSVVPVLQAAGVRPANGAPWESATAAGGAAEGSIIGDCCSASGAARAVTNTAASSGSNHDSSRGSSRDGSSSRVSCPTISWSYLLHLQNSRKLAAAYHAHQSFTTISSSSGTAAPDQDTLLKELLRLCCVLVDGVPLTCVCNNLACSNLTGVSEAAVAVKMCGGCGAAYCSTACQAAHWRRHKKACRRMQALGLKVHE